MKDVKDFRKIIFESTTAEGLPCAVVGNKATYDASGSRLSAEWTLPWSMPWINEELSHLAKKKAGISQRGFAHIQNKSEPDQSIDVLYRSILDITVGEAAEIASVAFAEKEAIVNCNGTQKYTYAELYEKTKSLTKGLISIGLEPGDKVAVWAVNSIEFVVAQFAITMCGCIFVPLSAYERTQYIEVILNQSNAKALIMQIGVKEAENMSKIYALCPELIDSAPGLLHSERIPTLRSVIVLSDQEYEGAYRWSDIVKHSNVHESEDSFSARDHSMSVDDPAHMIFTSGSTGSPKGVLLSHANIVENAYSMGKSINLSEQDIVCLQTPMFHCFGCVAGTLTSVLAGASMIMVDRFRPDVTLSIIERERCTVFSGVPTMFRSLLKVIDEQMGDKPYDFSSLRTGIVAGAPVDRSLVKAIHSKIGLNDLNIAYGLTEASPCVTIGRASNSDDVEMNVGRPVHGVEIKILDPATGAENVESGEICVRGYNVMIGYYGDPDATTAMIDGEGFLHTGDSGWITDDGRLIVEGRYKDIIIRCGENISPFEIESELLHLEDLVDVCIVGIPHALYGEEIYAIVRSKENAFLTSSDIVEYLRIRLPSNKIPRDVIFIDTFPKLSSGKYDRLKLRELVQRHIAVVERSRV